MASPTFRNLVWSIHKALIDNVPSKLADLIENTGVCTWIISHLTSPQEDLYEPLIPLRLSLRLFANVERSTMSRKTAMRLHLAQFALASFAVVDCGKYSIQICLAYLESLQNLALKFETTAASTAKWFR